jgi:hypothetical protein
MVLHLTPPPRRALECHALADEYAAAARDGRIPALSANLMAKSMLLRAVAIRHDEAPPMGGHFALVKDAPQ